MTTQVVNDGLNLVQATGQKVRDGVGAAAAGVRGEVGTVAHGLRAGISEIRQHSEHPAAHKRRQAARKAYMVQLTASAAGALAAFFVSRLVRTMLRNQGK